MSKIGHEKPLLDNTDPANMKPHALEPQLRIGQDVPVPDKAPEEVPKGLRVTEKERARIDGLVESGNMDRGTAVLNTVPTGRARPIIGHMYSSAQARKHQEGSEARQAAKAAKQTPPEEELIDLLRSPDK